MNILARTQRLHTPAPMRVLMSTLMLLTAFACLAFTPVHADNDDRRGRGHGERGHEQREHRDDEGGRHREWRGEDRYYAYRPVYPRPYVYAQPVYVPPPVYYAPRQSPGISLFFPLDLR